MWPVEYYPLLVKKNYKIWLILPIWIIIPVESIFVYKITLVPRGVLISRAQKNLKNLKTLRSLIMFENTKNQNLNRFINNCNNGNEHARWIILYNTTFMFESNLVFKLYGTCLNGRTWLYIIIIYNFLIYVKRTCDFVSNMFNVNNCFVLCSFKYMDVWLDYNWMIIIWSTAVWCV